MSEFRIKPPFGEHFDRMDAAAARNAGGLCTKAKVQSDGSMIVTNSSTDSWQTRAGLRSAFGRGSVEEVRQLSQPYHSPQEPTSSREAEPVQRIQTTKKIRSSETHMRYRFAMALWKQKKISGSEALGFIRKNTKKKA